MKRKLLVEFAALASGLIFGAGLLVSGMTQPEKVLAFLDIFGSWDPSLAFVMVGAIGVYFVALRLLARPKAALELDGCASVPPSVAPTGIDRKLVLGAVTFGVGWGLGGYCPGPSVVSLASGPEVWLFFAALLLGSWLADRPWERAVVATRLSSSSR
jgi:uncharacterized protein